MSENSENLLSKYREILLANGIHDKVSQVTMSDSGAKGDGMASLTQCVTVTFEEQRKAPLNLFVKLHTDNPAHEAMLKVMKAFEKEASFFMEYLPAAHQLCKSKGLEKLIDFYPKCYFGDESLIVLQNVVLEKDYEMLPHGVRHDFDTTILGLKTIAKHHALSLAVIQESGGMDAFLERFPEFGYNALAQPMLVELMITFLESGLKTCIAVAEKNRHNKSEEILATLNGFSGALSDILLDVMSFNKDDEKLLVLNHGDYKGNNMMVLRNKETNAILHHMAIDLQLACCNSPAFDIVTYLYTSVDPKVRQNRLEELLNAYRETLNETSRVLGNPVDLSYEDILMHYRKKFQMGILMATTVVGPGLALIKMSNIDISKVDVNDMAGVIHQCLLKWMEDNPEKGKDMAEEVENLVKEYNKLKL